MRWPQLVQLARALPEVAEDTWYGTPALKVRGKGFVRLKEDGQAVVFMLDSVDEQEFLIEARPDVYFITDHYRGWPSVLARLSALDAAECRQRLERSWRRKAPRALAAAFEGAASSKKPTARTKKPTASKKPTARAKKPTARMKKPAASAKKPAASAKKPAARVKRPARAESTRAMTSPARRPSATRRSTRASERPR